MTSLQGLLPTPGSSNWRKSRAFTADSDDDSILVHHVVIREVWLEKRPWPHAVYKVDVMSQTSHWFVFKRYKEFYQLHQKLVKSYNVPKDLLPPRRLANNMAKENLESRREALEHYLQKLLNSCHGGVRKSEELSEFLDVSSHDVPHVTYNLANYLKKNGQSILMSKETFQLSPSQLYCITKQKQLPHPSGRNTVDLANLYEFVGALRKLSITDFISQLSNGEQYEMSYRFDLGMFSSLRELQMDAINIESLKGIPTLRGLLNKITARYCLDSMKSLLIDAAVEKRTAPQVSLSAESWRIQAAVRLADNRIIFQPWHALTYANFSHNNITTFDTSMSLLPVLKHLDLSHNKINHLDLQLLTSPSLQILSLANNLIYLISGTTKLIDNLKVLNLSHNQIQSMEGLLCCHGLEELNLSFNKIALIAEVKKLSSLPNLYNLAVEGNFFTKRKRHRIIMFAYFRERQLILDKRHITPKEQRKLDLKFTALERFEDMDDSISSISTVSDDSDFDSGIDHSNWISKLASLSDIQEDEYEVIPKITWDELYAVDNEIPNSTCSSDQETENEEVLSREDWDRILKNDKYDKTCSNVLIPPPIDDVIQPKGELIISQPRDGNESEHSGATLKNSRHSTVCDEIDHEAVAKWIQTGAIPKRLDRAQSQHESKQRIRVKDEKNKMKRSISLNHDTTHQQDTTKNWLSNLFRRKATIPQKEIQKIEEGKKLNFNTDLNNADSANLIVIPEVEEQQIQENDVSRSFDDNCSFERAEECNDTSETLS